MGKLPFLMIIISIINYQQSNAILSLSDTTSVEAYMKSIADSFSNATKTSPIHKYSPETTMKIFINDTKLVIDVLQSVLSLTSTKTLEELFEPFISAIQDDSGFRSAVSNLINHSQQLDNFLAKLTDLIHFDENDDIDEIKAFTNEIDGSDGNNLHDITDAIYSSVTSGDVDNIYSTVIYFFTIYEEIVDLKYQCDYDMTLHERMKRIFDIAIINEIKAFIMTTFALNYRQITTNVNVESQITENINSTITRHARYITTMRTMLAHSSPGNLRCDAPKYVLGENCFRLEDLFEWVYVNQRQLSLTCDIDPDSFVSFNEIECLSVADVKYMPYYCPAKKCHGRLHNCVPAGRLSFCESPSEFGPRYLWATESEKLQEYCRGNYVDTMTKAPCDNLLCQCSEEGAASLAVRAVNLMPQMADIENNMVVTNVKFSNQDDMIHLQIEQGRLLPEGKIDEATIQMVPLGKFGYLQNTPEGSIVLLDDDDSAEQTYLEFDTDYTYLGYNRDKFFIDDIIAQPNYVVTGVKLGQQEPNPENRNNKSPIQLEIHVTYFNYHDGRLNATKEKPSFWMTPRSMTTDDYKYAREELDLSNVGDSLNNTFINVIDSMPNQFIKFQTSDDTNFGQTTVPYFDSRPAGVTSTTALSGVGIVHRGVYVLGGFLAPKIIGINHSAHVGEKESSE
ncbi:uncharacterized protein LOC130672909 [Microplitis mediator]|uniref:uncharacterized protein LOC130672909 n=1 Tax=Microplitis mediator TaxID=375433 RepID=UPI0025531704|nr:uncharacterized protein LOC130672909 [Microplitis mediator]